MRWLTLLGLLLSLKAQPAPTGSDLCGYRWYTESAVGNPDSIPTFQWVPTSQLNNGNPSFIQLLGDDGVVGPIRLPFEFTFYWNKYDEIYIGYNGYITFGRRANVASAGSAVFPTFPNSAFPNQWIAAYLADLTFVKEDGTPIPGARLAYGTDGAGRFVITWDSVAYWNGQQPEGWTGKCVFQIILDPRDNSILLQYDTISPGYYPGYGSGNYNVVGMENATGQSGLNIAQRWEPPFAKKAIKIWRPSSFDCTIRDIQADWLFNEYSQGVFLLQNGASPSVPAVVFNTGNQPTTGNIRCILSLFEEGNPQAIHRDTVLHTSGLDVDARDTVLFTRRLPVDQSPTTSLSTKPLIAEYQVNLLSGGDALPANNRLRARAVLCAPLQSGPNRGKYLLRFDDGEFEPAEDGAGGLGFPSGMTFVAPDSLRIEALSLDMLYQHQPRGDGDFPVALWVFAYDPRNDAIGQRLDSVGLRVQDFENGEVLDTLTIDRAAPVETLLFLRRYTVRLTNPIRLEGGQGLAVGFLTLLPSGPLPQNFVNRIVSQEGSLSSRRALEGVAGVWAPSREIETVDYAIGLVASALNPALGFSLPPLPPYWNAFLWPNPAKESAQVRIELTEGDNVVLRLMDMTGRLLWEASPDLPSGTHNLALPSGLAPGTYLLSVTYRGYTKGLRLVLY
ncbi:MAG: T9SS type A sorting domain-containing protein [Bacteroidia bacterium]|nr:T9SS type A sorting domain-containing protein [Bacteroidia bacterium]MDW8088635.1 T9SS type A sorting domain-containing protein [Bacteroidia bacterium]